MFKFKIRSKLYQSLPFWQLDTNAQCQTILNMCLVCSFSITISANPKKPNTDGKRLCLPTHIRIPGLFATYTFHHVFPPTDAHAQGKRKCDDLEFVYANEASDLLADTRSSHAIFIVIAAEDISRTNNHVNSTNTMRKNDTCSENLTKNRWMASSTDREGFGRCLSLLLLISCGSRTLWVNKSW